MVDDSGSWRHLFDLARQELVPETRRDLCARARKIIQDCLVTAHEVESAKRNELESALRQLWRLENEIDSSDRLN